MKQPNTKITVTFILALIVFSTLAIAIGFSDHVISKIAKLLTQNTEYCIYFLISTIFVIVIVDICIGIYKTFKPWKH